MEDTQKLGAVKSTRVTKSGVKSDLMSEYDPLIMKTGRDAAGRDVTVSGRVPDIVSRNRIASFSSA